MGYGNNIIVVFGILQLVNKSQYVKGLRKFDQFFVPSPRKYCYCFSDTYAF